MKGRGTENQWLLMKKNDEFSNSSFTLKTELTEKRLSRLKERIPPCKAE